MSTVYDGFTLENPVNIIFLCKILIILSCLQLFVPKKTMHADHTIKLCTVTDDVVNDRQFEIAYKNMIVN